jgi:hypothetical protein
LRPGTKHKVAARRLQPGADVEEIAFEPEGLKTWRAHER